MADDPGNPAPPPGYAAPRPGGGGTIAVVIGAVTLAVIAAAAFLLWQRGSGGLGGGGGPQAAATAFFRTNADRGVEAAYEAAAPTFRETAPASTWAAVSRGYKLESVTGAEWTRTSGDQVNATVWGDLHRTGDTDLPVAVDLHQADGQWRVTTVTVRAPAGSAAINPNPPLAAPQVAQLGICDPR